MKLNKKILLLICTLVLSISLQGCGNKTTLDKISEANTFEKIISNHDNYTIKHYMGDEKGEGEKYIGEEYFSNNEIICVYTDDNGKISDYTYASNDYGAEKYLENEYVLTSFSDAPVNYLKYDLGTINQTYISEQMIDGSLVVEALVTNDEEKAFNEEYFGLKLNEYSNFEYMIVVNPNTYEVEKLYEVYNDDLKQVSYILFLDEYSYDVEMDDDVKYGKDRAMALRKMPQQRKVTYVVDGNNYTYDVPQGYPAFIMDQVELYLDEEFKTPYEGTESFIDDITLYVKR